MTEFKLQGEPFEWPQKDEKAERCYPLTDTWHCYQNPWPGWVQPNLMTAINWRLKYKRQTNCVIKPAEELDNLLPVRKPSFSSQQNAYTWLGHSTCLFEMDGIAILTDPVFAESCAPPLSKMIPLISHHFKRMRPAPCNVAELPDNLQIVLLSHNHYDHLHYESIAALLTRYGSRLAFFIPSRLGETLHYYFPHINVIELRWWQAASFTLGDDKTFEVICCPNQHWSGRVNFYDTNWSLWCSWAVVGPMKKIFFAGDTGYCPAFTEIGREIGPFDAAAIPIGAYHPREFLSPQHVDPEEAVKIHLDVKAKQSFAIHWGTFPLGDEPFIEPRKKLAEAASNLKNKSSFITTFPGETIAIN